MYTTAATFAAKIKTLQEYHTRLFNGSVPLPTGYDVVNTLTSLKQSLQAVLKDMPPTILEMTKCSEKDSARVALFPAMDYKGLFNALVLLIEDGAVIHTGLQEFAQSLFCTIIYLIPFLERDLLSSLPYIASSSLIAFPVEMHRDIMNYLIYHILPFAIPVKNSEDSYISLSIPSVLMTVLQYSEELCQSSNLNAHHCHLLECLMALKANVAKDILNVIAYGPSYTRVSASKLLFNYWPSFDTNLFERGAAPMEITEVIPYACQCKNCPSGGNANVSKICYNVLLAAKFSTGTPPPLYLCIECANEIHREHPDQEFHDVLFPVHQASNACENKNCRSTEKNVVAMCFSMECACYNGNRPIRYCQSCHNSRHNNLRGFDHIYHTKLIIAWEMEPVMRTYLIDAAVSLLKEARPVTPEIPRDMTDLQAKAAAFNVISESSIIPLEDRQLMGRFGALLLAGLCMPNQDTPQEVVGRILSILFNWFRITAYTYDTFYISDQEEYSLEQLKKTHISKKLLQIHDSHFSTYVNCLLPHPANYARVGGHWEMMVTHTAQLKNGLNKIYCLTQYNLITQEVWDLIMPHWLEAIVRDVSEKELPELKMAISKMLDINQCTITNFDAKRMYHFIAIRFKRTSAKVLGQALTWLQILTLLDITLPVHMIFSFFEDAINSLIDTDENREDCMLPIDIEPRSNISPIVDLYDEIASGLSDDEGRRAKRATYTESTNETELKLQCCVLMLDITLKQMELHGVERYVGVHSVMAQDIVRLLYKTTFASWFMNHVCFPKDDCLLCECCIVWQQLATNLVEYVCPEDLAHQPDPPLEEVDDSKKTPPDSDKKEQKGDSLNSPFMEINTIMTATVETVVEQLDLAPIILTERVMPNMSRAITMPDSDTTGSAMRFSRPSIFSDIDSSEQHSGTENESCNENVWYTSMGKFRFVIEELPPQLQYIHLLLKEVARIENSNIRYYLLHNLYLLILHGDVLSKSVKDHAGFIIWCQENLIIKNMWQLCDSEHSHLSEMCVPLLLHCVTLPSGSDVFWKILQEEFHNSDWRVRFMAVERVTVMARFMDSTPLRNNYTLQAVLTNAICYLISSMDDLNELVAQRATLYLGTIHDYAMKSLIMCLETQFDSVIVDRPMVLQSLYQLHNSLSDRKILSWEFFLNRFDTLFIEAQIHLEKTGDVPHFRDLRNFDQTNESFVKKLQRAQEALSQTSDSSLVKTLSASFGTKWPYKRTMSAPASMLSRQDSKLEKDKVYNRQFSAPVLKRKSSRLGLESYGQQHSAHNDENNVYATLHRIIALEEIDRETTHLLIFLLMQFMSRSDLAAPSDEKNLSKIQNIVLRHLYLLLGYNQTERGFHVPPQVLRTTAVFNAFLSNLSQLLDQNFKMGEMIAPTTYLLLQYCPCPPHSIVVDFQTPPNYSLWNLEPHVRRNWIMAVFVFLYKYNYKKSPACSQVANLIRIVLNTLNAQHHVCQRIPPTVVMSAPSQPSHSRDMSQRSIGGETPPQSPGNLAHSSFRVKKSGTSMETHWEEEPIVAGKHGHPNLSGETEESELIHYSTGERFKSDSTVPGSSQGSFEDSVQLHDNVFKNGQFKKPVWYLGSEDQDNTKLGPSHSTLYAHSSGESISPGSTSAKFSRKSEVEEKIILGVTPEYAGDKRKGSSNYKTRCMKSPPICIPSAYSEESNDENDTELNKQTRSVYGSPESPLSKMDLHSIGSIEKDYAGHRRWTAGTLEFINSKELTLPVPERLLPIGKSPQRICEELNLASTSGTLSKTSKENKAEDKRPKSTSEADPTESKIHYPDKEKPETSNKSRSISPRHLIKQVALESPPDDVFLKSAFKPEESHSTLHKSKKMGSIPTNPHALLEYMQENGFWGGTSQRGSSVDPNLEQACHASYGLKQSHYRIGEDCTYERCSECGMIKEEYNDDEIGLCIIVLGTYVHREPALAAPILDQILSIIIKFSAVPMYSWQAESNINLPGSSSRVARQFLKVIFQQLIPNGVFIQVFRTSVQECGDVNFFRNVVQALVDFKEVCPVTPLVMLFEMMNSKKSLPLDRISIILNNTAAYLECILMENLSVAWGPFLTQVEIFFRKVALMMSNFDSFSCFFKNMICILRVPGIVLFKSILDPFSKVLNYGVENFTINYKMLLEVCFHCNRAFTRERDKLMLTRIVVFELTQALKAKVVLTEANLITLINFVLQDIGGIIPSSDTAENLLLGEPIDAGTPVLNTGAAEVMRQSFTDALDFVADFHSLMKIKSNYKCNLVTLNEDTLGVTLKAGISQYIALELTRGTSRDNRVLARYFPWLCNTPAVQQTIREFADCMGHVRLLCWLLIGSLTNNCVLGSLCQPVPQEVSCYVADHVQVVLSGFPEQSKTSTVHMASLYHSFVLCQLWTIYLEHVASAHKANTEPYVLTMSILFDFWSKVTPTVLRLISHSKVMSDMVNLHFVSVVEGLLECRSSSLTKLLPVWRPILNNENSELPGHLLMRLQNCQNFPPPACVTISNANVTSSVLLKWLQRLQFRMGQIELQASQATQFYSL